MKKMLIIVTGMILAGLTVNAYLHYHEHALNLIVRLGIIVLFSAYAIATEARIASMAHGQACCLPVDFRIKALNLRMAHSFTEGVTTVESVMRLRPSGREKISGLRLKLLCIMEGACFEFRKEVGALKGESVVSLPLSDPSDPYRFLAAVHSEPEKIYLEAEFNGEYCGRFKKMYELKLGPFDRKGLKAVTDKKIGASIKEGELTLEPQLMYDSWMMVVAANGPETVL